MINHDRYNFADFTRHNYLNLLRMAKDKYVFRSYDNFEKDGRFVLWRHDLDFSVLTARKLAQIESAEGIAATYFLHLHSEFYNLLEKENTGAVREIISMGHQIGLHLDCDYYRLESEGGIDRYLLQEKRFLEEIFAQPVKVFSFHNPDSFTTSCNRFFYAGLINSSSDYFKTKVGYCSDSNGYWRHRRLEDVLKESREERLQVLTHPAWWQEKVMSPKGRVWRCIDGRAEKTKEKYDELLRVAGRKNIDWE